MQLASILLDGLIRMEATMQQAAIFSKVRE